MQIKQLFLAASIALPAVAVPLPVDNSKIVIVDKMPPSESGDDRTAVHKREEYGLKIPQRWYCAEDADQLEYISAFGRNTLGIPPYCKGNWQGKEDWKPRQREGEGKSEGDDEALRLALRSFDYSSKTGTEVVHGVGVRGHTASHRGSNYTPP